MSTAPAGSRSRLPRHSHAFAQVRQECIARHDLFYLAIAPHPRQRLMSAAKPATHLAYSEANSDFPRNVRSNDLPVREFYVSKPGSRQIEYHLPPQLPENRQTLRAGTASTFPNPHARLAWGRWFRSH